MAYYEAPLQDIGAVEFALLIAVCLIAFLLYVWTICALIQEWRFRCQLKAEYERRGYPYVKDNHFLWLADNSSFIELTVQKRGPETREHYCEGSLMVIAEMKGSKLK